MIFVVLNQYFN